MRKFMITLAAVATVAFATAEAGASPLGKSIGSAADRLSLIEQSQFVYLGRNYCFYDDGWNGPGWYWCGYRYRPGYGWGGGLGWRGWGRGGGRFGGSRFGGQRFVGPRVGGQRFVGPGGGGGQRFVGPRAGGGGRFGGGGGGGGPGGGRRH